MLDCGLKFLIYEVKPPGCGSLVDKLFGLQLRAFEGNCQFDLWPVHAYHVGDQSSSQGHLRVVRVPAFITALHQENMSVQYIPP